MLIFYTRYYFSEGWSETGKERKTEAEGQKEKQCLVIQRPGDKAVTSGLTEGSSLKAGAQEMYFLCH